MAERAFFTAAGPWAYGSVLICSADDLEAWRLMDHESNILPTILFGSDEAGHEGAQIPHPMLTKTTLPSVITITHPEGAQISIIISHSSRQTFSFMSLTLKCLADVVLTDQFVDT